MFNKFILILSFIFSTNLLWAQDNGDPNDPTHPREPSSITVQIGTSFSVTRICDQYDPICFGHISPRRNVDIVLRRFDDNPFTPYTGFWSEVIEYDGHRWIAIIKISLNGREDTTVVNYTVNGDIISYEGLGARAYANVGNLNDLNDISLYGPITRYGTNRYQAILDIGAPRSWPTPIPCNPDDGTCFPPDSSEGKNAHGWIIDLNNQPLR